MSIQEEARSVIRDTILARVEKVVDYAYVPVEATGLLHNYNGQLKMTHFNDLYDTLIYSKLIFKALTLNPEVKRIIDLGAGSSVPTILAVKQSERKDIRVTAVDIDDEAIEVSRKNAEFQGLADQYDFEHSDMESVIKKIERGPETLVVSNPPYIATPEELNSHRHFVPINGGAKGDKYLLKILEQDYKPGTILGLLWGSLTSPHHVVSHIKNKFEIVYAEAYRIHFGQYTNDPSVKAHLYKMREQGLIFFDVDKEGETQIVLGTILRAL